jgi:hypothetical protein
VRPPLSPLAHEAKTQLFALLESLEFPLLPTVTAE